MAASGVVLSNVWEVKTVKSTHRLAAPVAGLLALSFAAAPLMAQGGGGLGQAPLQRGGPPNGDTPYILITTFHSDDRNMSGTSVGSCGLRALVEPAGDPAAGLVPYPCPCRFNQ